MPQRLIIGLLLSMLAPVSGAEGLVHVKGTNLAALVVIERSELGDAPMQTLVATLQGLVARSSAEQIYITAAGGYTLWLEHLRSQYRVPITRMSDPWAVLERFQDRVAGYILYDRAQPNSINAATALCGPFNAIAVERTLEAAVRARGITNRLLDVSARNEAWVWSHYAGRFNPRVIVEQDESKYFHLRDYAVLANAFTFADGNSAFRTSVLRTLAPNAAVLGWGTGGESEFVGDSSRQGAFTVPSDWALNLSTLSSVQDQALYQRTFRNPVPEANVHYVTFIATDGDNVQWNLGGFPGYFNHPARGQFDMGWALSPALADLAPAVLDWYYRNASNGLHRDCFVAGPSGGGYFYPSLYPPAELDAHVTSLNALLAAADLNIVQIIDFDSFDRLDLWSKYTAQPAVAALIYLEFAPYNGAHGAVNWVQGKPVIGAREMLWAGLPGADAASVITHLNRAPRDPSSPEGYSVVVVHVWSQDLGEVQTVVNGLAPDVRVVTPDDFVKLLQANIGDRLAFDFATGLQSWAGDTAGKPFDKAQWTGNEGSGALLLDGSDLGQPDSQPNAWFSRQVNLPTNALTLRFRTRALNDGRLRVRLQLPDSTRVTLLDWETLPNGNWAQRSVGLRPYAGRTVRLFFEHNDGGQGSGEYRFVDDIAVVTDGPPPAALPAAPKLLSAITNAQLEVELLWRDNSRNELWFDVQRRVSGTGTWIELVTLPAKTTRYTDHSVNPGQRYEYRVRARNHLGASAYSAARTVTTPELRLSIRRFGPLLIVEWPGFSGFEAQCTTDLGPPAQWQPVTEPLDTNSSLHAIRFLPRPGSRFFRLVR